MEFVARIVVERAIVRVAYNGRAASISTLNHAMQQTRDNFGWCGESIGRDPLIALFGSQ